MKKQFEYASQYSVQTINSQALLIDYKLFQFNDLIVIH